MNKKTNKIISQEEMRSLENFNRTLLNSKESFCLDLFLFSFYTGGFSLGDIACLKREDIGNAKLNSERFKYPLLNSISLNEKAISIINKYENQSDESYVFPIFTHKYNTSTQRKNQIKRLAYKINKVLHKASDVVNIENRHLTWETAKYTFIMKLFEEKRHPKAIYSFAGITALAVESYLYEQESPSEREAREKKLREDMNRIFCRKKQ